MIVRKRSNLTSSSDSSRRSSITHPASATTEAWDVDDEDTMSAEEHMPSRPLSMAIPQAPGVSGPYCPRRPNLREILTNTSVAPWTLAAFMAYLSNNHCLETLEFTMDAGRYKKHYQKMMGRAEVDGMPPATDREYVQALWQRLVDAYIRPNGSREVNLQSQVRDPILFLAPSELPPAPETLDTAVAKIYELMEESVLVPFLNSVYPHSVYPGTSSCPCDPLDEGMPRTRDDRSLDTRRGRHDRHSPGLPHSAVEPLSHSYNPISTHLHKPNPSNLTTSMNRSRHSVRISPTTSTPTGSMTTVGEPNPAAENHLSTTTSATASVGHPDENGSTDSHNYDSHSTPPTSPPGSDASPKRDSGMWKKLGRLSGMKSGKKKGHGTLKEEH